MPPELRSLRSRRARRGLFLVLILSLLLPRSPARAYSPPDQDAAFLVLGQPDFTTGSAGSGAGGFSAPRDIAVDPTSGKVFVVEYHHNRVLRFAAAADLANGAAAEAVLGQPDFDASTSNTTRNGMYYPSGLFVDSAGRLWVTDMGNNRILRFDNAAGLPNGAPADGVLGQPDFNTTDALLTADGMHQPEGVYLDPGGRLWVADTGNNRILRFDDAATKPNGAAADGVLGQDDFTSWIPSGELIRPYGLIGDAEGRLYAADASHRILRFDSAAAKANGAPHDGQIGQGHGTSQSHFDNPFDLALDPSGRLWITDTNNHRIVYFNRPADAVPTTPADGVLGQPNFTSGDPNHGGLSARSLNYPTGLFFDPALDVLWVADWGNNRVLAFSDSTLELSGDGQVIPAGDDSPSAADRTLFGAVDLGASNDRSFRVANRGPAPLRFTGSPRVQISGPNAADFSVVAQPPATLDPFAARGFTLCFSPSANGFRTAQVTLLNSDGDTPAYTFTIRGQGGIHTAANYHAAERVLGQPSFFTNLPAAGPSGLNTPSEVAVDPATGKVFVADTANHRVLRYAGAANLANGAAAEAVLGQPDFSASEYGLARNRMRRPIGVFVDAAGRLWVADSLNHRVLRFDGASTRSSGASADGVLGQPDFTTANPAAGARGMQNPNKVFVDKAGRLWVSDTLNHRVLRFDQAAAKPDGAPADGVLGQADFSAQAAALAQNRLNAPIGLFVDPAGRLWLADSENHRLLRFDAAAGLPNGANASGVLGQPGFSSNLAGVSGAEMYSPGGVTVDAAGRLWLADWGNNRLLRFDGAASLANGAPADGVLGQNILTTSTPNLGGLSETSLFQPRGVFYSAYYDALWVADGGNHRLLAYTDANMAVLGLGRVIPDDDESPSAADGSDFGSVDLGEAVSHAFTIRNNGLQDLALTGAPLVQISGPNAADFAVLSQPTAVIAAYGGSSGFQIRFTPHATGLRTAQVIITSADPDAPDYTFTIQGLAVEYQYLYLPLAIKKK